MRKKQRRNCRYTPARWGQTQAPVGQFRRAGLLFWLSLLLIFLSACSSSSAAGRSSSTPSPTVASITPTPLPTPTQLQKEQAQALQILAGMSIDQKLGQLIVVEYLGNDYTRSGLKTMITQQDVGGLLYQYVNQNFLAPDNTVAGLAAFSSQLQKDARIPLYIGTDQEGGQVNRLATFHGDLPSAQEIAASGDPQYAYNQGKQDAQWLLQLGINGDLAPVVDVHTVDPPILQDRMFGSTPQTVETYAGAFLNGLQQNGVLACLKHFPGLGAVTSDPHLGLPTVNRSLADLEKIDLAPYKQMIAHNDPAMIMDTDVVMSAIDSQLPAELSSKTVDGLLRGQLGYNGVVITDGLYMDGISERWSISQAALMAIQAGDDMIEGPYTTSQVAKVLTTWKQALQNGQLTMARVDQSVTRILLMKIERGIIK